MNELKEQTWDYDSLCDLLSHNGLLKKKKPEHQRSKCDYGSRESAFVIGCCGGKNDLFYLNVSSSRFPVKPCVAAKVTVLHVTGFNVRVGPVKLEIVRFSFVFSLCAFLLPQAPPSLSDPGDEPTQRAPVSTPDADLGFDADQQTAPPECCSSTLELPT